MTHWAFFIAEMSHMYRNLHSDQENDEEITASPCDLSGENLHLAPDWSGRLYADLTVPMTGTINVVANLNVSMSDSYYTDGSLEPAGEQDSWTNDPTVLSGY